MPNTAIAQLTRLDLPVDADLTQSTLHWAIEQLVKHEDQPQMLWVHPHAKHFAEHLAYTTGFRMPVEIHKDLTEDEWLLCGTRYAVHSDGA